MTAEVEYGLLMDRRSEEGGCVEEWGIHKSRERAEMRARELSALFDLPVKVAIRKVTRTKWITEA